MTEGFECTFHFTHKEDALRCLYSGDMAGALFEIDQLCRNRLKYSECSEDLAKFCEVIRLMIRESVDLDRLYR